MSGMQRGTVWSMDIQEE